MSNTLVETAQKLSFKWEAQRILILDKDDQFRFLARTIFQRHRTNEVLSTSSMAEAVLHLMASPVNACLVGVAENEPAGIEFLRWLRDPKASPCPKVPVAALTDSKNPAFIAKICRFGIEGLLRKPVSQESLTRRISGIILEPKRMVVAPGYLGPDRRDESNGVASFGGPERRRPSEPILAEPPPNPPSAPSGKVVLTKTAVPSPKPPQQPRPQAPPLMAPAVPAPPPVAAPQPVSKPAPPPVAAPAPVPKPAAAPAPRPIAPPQPLAAAVATPSVAPPPPKPAPPPVARPAPAVTALKPVGGGTKLELDEPPAPPRPVATKLDLGDMPAPLPAIKLTPLAPPPTQAPRPAPPSLSPAAVLAVSTVSAAPPAPPKPKANPAKLTFDLAGILDAHRNWVLSRGVEGGRATLSRQNMSGCDLSGAILTQADLTYCRLTGAECSEARLDGADLRYADLAGADLTEAVLGASRLRHVNLEGATLKGANLRGADLSGADLRGADLEGAQLQGATMLDTLIHDTDLSTADGLTQAQINKTRRNVSSKLPPGLRLNLPETEQPAPPSSP
ncbi:MAG: pentapeptide repeat-containing protein [Alphaproteobacteria bacterium]|nr:pentapeptide repeat-containing protein [Alphaproteobacteria bacterium]